MRVSTAIGAILLTLGACADSTEPPPPASVTAALSCAPWADGAAPPGGRRLVQSADQSLPGTDSWHGSPVPVVVGNACVVLPPEQVAIGLYCGAAVEGAAPQPCLIGEECAVGSIMVTDVAQFQEAEGAATCATFENWSKTAARSIFLWAKTR